MNPIPLIARWLIGRNPAMTQSYATRLARIGVATFAIIALVIAVTVWSTWHDAAVIERHELEERAEEAEQSLAAERRANDADTTRQESAEAAHEQTQTELETIHAEDPVAAKAPASRGSRAVARRLPSN